VGTLLASPLAAGPQAMAEQVRTLAELAA
jgi:hypothetical protein